MKTKLPWVVAGVLAMACAFLSVQEVIGVVGFGQASLSASRTWPTIEADTLGGLKFQLRTKWKDGRIYYVLNAQPFNSVLRQERKAYRSQAAFHLMMHDKEGFTLFKESIPVNSMTGVLGVTEEPVCLTFEGDAKCAKDQYASLGKWNIGWSGFPPIAQAPPKPLYTPPTP